MVEGISSGGIATATCDQDIKIIAVGLIWPEGVTIAYGIAAVPRCADLRSIQVHNWQWVRPLLVLLCNRTVIGWRLGHDIVPFREAKADRGSFSLPYRGEPRVLDQQEGLRRLTRRRGRSDL